MTLAIALLLSGALITRGIQGTPDPLAQARAQFDRGEYRVAITTLSSAIETSPHDAQLWHWRSRCYLELGDYNRAIDDGDRAVTERPRDSEYRRWLGRAYGAAAEHRRSFSIARKVRAAFEQAVRLDPSNIAARRDLMEFYVEAPWIVGGDKRKALEQVDAIAQLDVVAGHLARAAYLAGTEHPNEANAEYQRVLDARPDGVDPYLEVADESLDDAGRFASAVEQASRVAAADIRLTYYKGVALILANRNLIEAERLLSVYLATAPRRSDLPSHADTYIWCGRLNERLGHIGRAVDHYRAALALDRDSKTAREALRALERATR